MRLDGTSHHYAPAAFPAVASFSMTEGLVRAKKKCDVPYHVGISVSSDTFWPGQERYDSFSGYVPRVFRGSMKEWRRVGCFKLRNGNSNLVCNSTGFGLAGGALCGVVAKRTDSERIAPNDIYQKAFAYQIKTVKAFIADSKL